LKKDRRKEAVKRREIKPDVWAGLFFRTYIYKNFLDKYFSKIYIQRIYIYKKDLKIGIRNFYFFTMSRFSARNKLTA
jgi:hypothetical protein